MLKIRHGLPWIWPTMLGIVRSGPGDLNRPIGVETAPKGEDIVRDDRSKDEQKTPPHALSGIQVQSVLISMQK